MIRKIDLNGLTIKKKGQIQNSPRLIIIFIIFVLSSACTVNDTEIVKPTYYSTIAWEISPTMIMASTPINPDITSTLTSIPTLTASKISEPYLWNHISIDGGYTFDLAIDPHNSLTLYLAEYSGMYKSIDGGMTWNSINLSDACDIAVDPVTTSNIYVWTSNGLFKSSDSGVQWRKISNKQAPSFCGNDTIIAINPLDPKIIYLINDYILEKSTDGGDSWNPNDYTNWKPNTIAVDPIIPTTLYIGTSDGLIFKSIDDGENWIEVKHSNLEYDHIRDIEIDPITDTTIYAAISGIGIIKSTNGGETWRDISNGMDSIHISSISINPNNPSILYVSTESDIYKSTNGGLSWRIVDTSGISSMFNCLAIDPITPSTLYAGTLRGGVAKSVNSGEAWVSINFGLYRFPSVSAIAIDSSTPAILYAGVDNRGVLKSNDGGRTWIDLYIDGTGFSFITIDPTSPSTIYIDAWWIGKSTNGGRSWKYTGIPEEGGMKAVELTSLAIDPIHSNNLYVGVGQYYQNYEGEIYKSTNGGINWKPIKIGLSSQESVYAIAIDPMDTNIIYAGTSGHGVYKSINAGENWNMANSGISNSQITTLVLDPMTPSTLYAGTSGEGIYKSVDGGLNWKAVNSELPNTISIKKITINPQWPKIIYMCTYGPSEKYKSGVYKSIDGGENWIYLGLGDIELNDLVIFPNTPSILYVGSEKGIYSLQQ